MSGFPDTSTSGPRRRTVRTWRIAAPIVAVSLLGAFLIVVLEAGKESPPREEIHAQGVEEIAASEDDVPFPNSDTSRFGEETEVVFVYLRGEDLKWQEGITATVERSGRSSAFSWLSVADDIRVEDGGEGRLSVAGEGASGVVSFAVRGGRGGALPHGDYVVEVRSASRKSDAGDSLIARKYFRVGG